MKIIFELLKKDLLKFRWLLLLWLALIVSWHVALLMLNGENFEVVFGSVTALKIITALFLPILTLLVIQEDAAAGSTAFWPTRPLPAWKILTVKALLFLALMVSLTAIMFFTTKELFRLSAADTWRIVSDSVETWFCFVPIYALVASVTRNFLTAFGVLLALMVVFIVSAAISANRIFFHLWWMPMFAVPLAGVIVQYYTRRVRLTVGGCVLAVVIAIAFHTPLPRPGTQKEPRTEPKFSEQLIVENISVIVSDGNVIISGEFDKRENRMFDREVFPLTFDAGDGEAIKLDDDWTAKSGPSGQIQFSFTLRPDELKRLGEKTGTLRMRIGGRFFHYEPLTMVPLDSKRRTVMDGMRVFAVTPDRIYKRASSDTDGNTVSGLISFSTIDNIRRQNRYKYILYYAAGNTEIPLRSRTVFGMVDFVSGAIFERLSTREPLPATLDGYVIRIDLRVYDEGTFGATVEIPNFSASGTAALASPGVE